MNKKRASVMMICLVFAVSYVCGGFFTQKKEAYASVAGDWAAGKALDGVFNVINAVFLGSIGALADGTDNDDLKNICKFISAADNLFFAGSAQDASEQIKEKLDAMEQQISDVELHLQGQLNEMFNYEIKHNFSAIQSDLNKIYNKHDRIADAYEAYIDAASQYSSAVLEESKNQADKSSVEKAKAKMEEKQKTLEGYFHNKLDEKAGKSLFMSDLQKDLDTIVENTCRYYPSKTTDSDKKRNYISDDTYLYEAWTLLNQNVPFEHQKYDGMIATANDCAKDLEMLMRIGRYWYDYQYANFADDPEKASQLQENSNTYQEIMNQCINALGDISEQCKEKTSGLMRPHDLEVTKEMEYKESETHSESYLSFILPYIDKYVAKAVTSKPEMDFYRVCVEGTPYLILKDIGSNRASDYVDDELARERKAYNLSQDYFNFRYTKDRLYSMPATYQQLLPITSAKAYNGSGYNLTNYLVEMGGLEKLPRGKVPYVVTQEISSMGYSDFINFDVHFDAYWCSTNISPTDTKKARATVNLHSAYKSSDKVYTVLAGHKDKKEESKVSLELSDRRGSLEVLDEKGDAVKGKVEAGTPLTLKLKIKEGARLKNLRWISKGGKIKETIASGDSLKIARQDEDGTYTFTYPMSYQDCTFRADFTNAKEEGKGTEENPYLISSAQDYVDYATKAKEDASYNKANYKLTQDIDFVKEKASANEVLGRSKEGFTGTFDGGGHAITGLDWLGVVDTIGKDGIVRNLLITTGDRGSLAFMSLIAGENNGLITGCGILGNNARPVTNSYDGAIGAIVQVNGKTGRIENCYNALSITAGGSHVRSGAIAVDNAGTIVNCYNTGDIDSQSRQCGGISFINRTGSTVSNCYNAGTISGQVFEGEKGADLKDLFYQTGKDVYSPQGTGLTEEQMKGEDLLAALNKNVTKTEGLCQWLIKEGANNGYPILGTVPHRYALSTDIKGKGSLAITDDEDQEIHKAVSGMTVKVTATPGDGRQVDNLKLYDEKGKTLKKLEVTPDEKGIVKTSFAMPDQNTSVHVKFAQAEKPADGQQTETSGTDERKQKDSVAAMTGGGPVYDKAVLTDKNTGIIVTGDQVDTRAVLKVEAYDETDPQHKQIEDAASDDVLASYDVSLALIDEHGKEIVSDAAKFKGSLDVAFPIKESDRDKNLKILHGNEDGLQFEDGGLGEDGLYHVEVSHLSPFAVVEHQEDLEADLSAGETIETESGGSAWSWIAIACLAAAAIAASIILTVRKRRKEKGEAQ